MVEQTVPLHEIVISDDSSDDSTLDIVEAVVSRSSIPLRIVRGERNLGIRKNFERGLLVSSGDIVFLADQDDVWRPDKVERMLEEFSHRPELGLLFTDARLINGDGDSLHRTLFRSLRIADRERRRVSTGLAFDALLRRNLATGATIAVRRAIVLRALPIPEGWLHDEWLAVVAAASSRIDFLDEPLTDYRQHDSNHIGSGRDDLRSILKKLRSCRRCFNRRLLRRTELQIERLRFLEPAVSESQIASLQSKLQHLQRRCELPQSRLARVPTVIRECLNGGYRHYSSGLRSVCGDLFGAIRETTDHSGC
jgi:glycosyltransferase involved in cell wall biosynthesis